MVFAQWGSASRRFRAFRRRRYRWVCLAAFVCAMACGPSEPPAPASSEVADAQRAIDPRRLSPRKPESLCRQAFSLASGELAPLLTRSRAEGRLDDLAHCFALPPFERLLTT